jgi:hypothetical protein
MEFPADAQICDELNCWSDGMSGFWSRVALAWNESMRQAGGWNMMWLITLFWVLMAGVSTFQTYYFYATLPSSPPPERALYLAGIYSLLWALATPLVFFLARVFPIERATLLTHLPLHLLFSVVLGIAHRAAWLALQLQIPAIRPSREVTWERAMADIVTSFDYQSMVYWVLLATHQGALYYRKYQEGRLQASRLETQLAQAQLSGLKMQLHPHFLFNTLNSIHCLMFDKPAQASEMLVRLSDFLRLSLENTGLQAVTLEQELNFIERYLEIERTRFEERLRVEYRVEDLALDCAVPNLVLQPLVENAIKHGISRNSGNGVLRISANVRNGCLSIFVANSGPLLTSDPFQGPQLGIGLTNTRARLRALYGADQQFALRNWHEGGVEAYVSFPARRMTDESLDR